MSRGRFSHWELTALGTAAALSAWIAAPGLLWAVVALAGAVATMGLALRSRRVGQLVLAAIGLGGALGVLTAARRIRAVETDWPSVRENLIEDARRRLDATLGDAVDLARALAAEGIGYGGGPPGAAFGALERVLRPGAPEHGVVLFDATRRPWSWAGRHRVPVVLRDDQLYAYITPFYVVLTAQRQQGGWTAVSQVLLAADSSVPDRANSVSARFAQRLGVRLEFLSHGATGAAERDVFDYCLPGCRSADVTPDTLFSVRAVPPEQGERKLQLLAGGRRWAAVVATLSLLALVVVAGRPVRYAAMGGLVATYVFTPAGDHVGLAAGFTPATFYVDPLGPFAASAGALLCTAGFAAVATVGLWRRPWRRRGWGEAVALALVVAAPYALTRLARGITPPPSGVSLGLWVSWEVTLTAAICAILLVASAVVRTDARPRLGAWVSWAAGAWAALVALVGLVVWRPAGGWPSWYVFLWIPALLLAIQPAGIVRTAVTNALVAGSAAALLTWGATVEGRVALAERDLARVLVGEDPITAGLLERYGAGLVPEAAPRNAAGLYRLWRRSALAQDDYPAVLATWDPQGKLVARLDLAELDLPAALLQALARTAAQGHMPLVESLNRGPGLHYVLAVPFRDGSVVTAGVGSRSRAFPPVRVARFLRGERVLGAPYEISLSEPFARALAPQAGWRREDWTLRAERSLDLPVGPRHLHLRVDLGDPAQLVVRGILVVLADAVLVGLLWLAGYALAGPVRGSRQVLDAFRPRSYRARLTLVLSIFFVAPTVGFAVWSLARVRDEADRGAQLLTRQTLRDASTVTRDMVVDAPGPTSDRLRDLGGRFGADLLVYESGVLAGASAPVLLELGLVDPYLPAEAFRHLLIEDDLEVTQEVQIGGRSTQVGFRNIGTWQGRPIVLGAPRLLDDAELLAEREDLVMTLTLATLAGLAAAAWLAAAAARALARPVHALRAAAVSVGQGLALPPRDPTVPLEFVPVVEGLERMARDVRASQEALEAARQRTAAVLRSVATGVVALDRDLRVTMANPRAEELLGAALPEGGSVRDLTGDDWQSLWEWVEAFVGGGGEPQAPELVVGERRIRAQVASLGHDGRCVVALDDTTDLAHAVRVLAWGELARQIAHEIKNPLTPLRLGIQHLERAYRDRREDYAETLRRTAGQILAEIERLDSIARAFARFGAPPAEAGPLARENLAEAARETAQLYALGGEAVVTVRAGPSVYARVRRDEFKEVLVNLIENARTAGAGRIEIAVESRDGGGATVRVRDDGHGIKADDLPHIFEPQFSTTTSGTGLGLAICKRLVESWNATIGVETGEAVGTTVILTAGP